MESKIIGGGVRGLNIGRIVYLDTDITKNHDRKSAEKSSRKSSAKIFKESGLIQGPAKDRVACGILCQNELSKNWSVLGGEIAWQPK